MSEYTPDQVRVALHVIKYGMAMPVHKLTDTEKRRVLRTVRRMLDDGHDPEDLINAARFGMRKTWPFNDGQPWDDKDFAKYITKAKSAASGMAKRGEIPLRAESLKED